MDEQLHTPTVGIPRRGDVMITLVPYDPIWPVRFAQLAHTIRTALGDGVLLLEHVGSTAVPGLTAKPIIDLLLAVADSRDEASYVAPLERCGYTLRHREPEWYEHRLLNPPGIAGNLHVFTAGCPEIEQMLLFRDWLRAHPDERARYAATKHELAAQTWASIQHYADAKTPVVRAILARAR